MTVPPAPHDLDKLEALNAARTPGPWKAHERYGSVASGDETAIKEWVDGSRAELDDVEAYGGRLIGESMEKYDRDFIAELANQADSLIAAARQADKLREENTRLNRCIVEHHNIAHLSDDAIRESFGGLCQICRRANPDVLAASPAAEDES